MQSYKKYVHCINGYASIGTHAGYTARYTHGRYLSLFLTMQVKYDKHRRFIFTLDVSETIKHTILFVTDVQLSSSWGMQRDHLIISQIIMGIPILFWIWDRNI